MIRTLLLCAVAGAILAGPVGAQDDAGLVANGGFEEGAADALSGWENPSGREGVALDDDVRHSGGRSLRISAPGGVHSTLVPYPGGRVQVTGWMKTQDLVRGPSRSWHKAALQLISYDSDRKAVGHRDVTLVDGTHDWTRYEATCLLSREVAFIAVFCQIWGADTRGTVWFDDVSMRALDDPATFDRCPMDLDAATMAVDFARPLGKFRHLWIGSDVSFMDRVISSTQVNAMKHAREFGFRYLRMHDCVFNPRIYSEDEQGAPVYEWAAFDQRVDAVVDAGMWPVIVLETMPREIAGRYSGKPWTNPYPPEDAAAYLKWQRLVHEIVAHCRQRWGEDIHNWYFEVWNEPDARGYFEGSLEDYLKIYDHAVAGAVSADLDIRIGGPAGAGNEWVRPFLEHCRSGRNDATGLTGCRTDFVSWHIYTVGVGLPVFDALPVSLAAVRQTLDEMPEYRDLPTFITEWGCSSSRHPAHNRPYDAAFRTMAVRMFMDYGITLALPFALGAGPPHAHDGFQGGLAMFSKTTIPKPSFRAFELLHRMNGTRVLCESSNDPVGGLACVAPDGNSAWVMLYNLMERHTGDPYTTNITVTLAGLPDGDWRCSATSIAPGECDPYPVWKDMGSPEKLTQDQWDALLRASELPAPAPVSMASDALRIAMPGFSALQLELRRD